MNFPFPIEVLHSSYIAWQNNENYLHSKEPLFPWEKESIVPAMQHGCHAKPLYQVSLQIVPKKSSHQKPKIGSLSDLCNTLTCSTKVTEISINKNIQQQQKKCLNPVNRT